jgi:hypothetical protein
MLKNGEWECVICNDPDNDYELCADIQHGNNTAAFIKNKDGKRVITLYEKDIDIPFDWFFEAMQVANNRVS